MKGFPGGSEVKCLPVMRKIWVWSMGQEDPLEEEMATHSSILAWKIPWMEKPGRLQSMGTQRVRHNWTTSLLKYQMLNKYLANEWIKTIPEEYRKGKNKKLEEFRLRFLKRGITEKMAYELAFEDRKVSNTDQLT